MRETLSSRSESGPTFDEQEQLFSKENAKLFAMIVKHDLTDTITKYGYIEKSPRLELFNVSCWHEPTLNIRHYCLTYDQKVHILVGRLNMSNGNNFPDLGQGFSLEDFKGVRERADHLMQLRDEGTLPNISEDLLYIDRGDSTQMSKADQIVDQKVDEIMQKITVLMDEGPLAVVKLQEPNEEIAAMMLRAYPDNEVALLSETDPVVAQAVLAQVYSSLEISEQRESAVFDAESSSFVFDTPFGLRLREVRQARFTHNEEKMYLLYGKKLDD